MYAFITDQDYLRQCSHQTFLAFVSFLCQLFAHLMDNHGRPFFVLVEPVFHVLEKLLVEEASEPELRCAACQVRSFTFKYAVY